MVETSPHTAVGRTHTVKVSGTLTVQTSKPD